MNESARPLSNHRWLQVSFGQGLTSRKSCASLVRRLARTRALPKWLWKLLRLDLEFRVEVSPGRSFQYHTIPQDNLGRQLLFAGLQSFEPETLRVLPGLVEGARRFLDVGAHTGLYTLLAAALEPNLKIAAVEPLPSAHERLLEHLKLNGLLSRCQAHRLALGRDSGQLTLRVPRQFELPQSASLEGCSVKLPEGALVDEVDVPVVTGASLVEHDGGAPIDLVKLDVEGAEALVLEGLRSTLETDHPALIFECNPEGPLTELETILGDLGYQLFQLSGDGPIPRGRILPDMRRRETNYLGLHPEGFKREMLQALSSPERP